jgi:hypothetical protein
VGSELALEKGRLPGPGAPLRLARLWTFTGWRMLFLAGVGIVIAVLLLSTVPLYSGLVSNAQLQHELSTQTPQQIDIEATVSLPVADASSALLVRSHVQPIAQSHLGSFASTSTLYLETPDFLRLDAVNGQAPPQRVLTELPGNAAMQPLAYDYRQALSHMQLLAGRLPADTPHAAPAEVLATPALGVRPGATLRINCACGLAVKARVVGVWQPRNPADPFWNGRSFETIIFQPNPSGGPTPPPIYPLLFTQHDFLDRLGTTYSPAGLPIGPTTGVTVHMIYYTQRERITVSNLTTVAGSVAAFRLD